MKHAWSETEWQSIIKQHDWASKKLAEERKKLITWAKAHGAEIEECMDELIIYLPEDQ